MAYGWCILILSYRSVAEPEDVAVLVLAVFSGAMQASPVKPRRVESRPKGQV
jgi:hypothetical protein